MIAGTGSPGAASERESDGEGGLGTKRLVGSFRTGSIDHTSEGARARRVGIRPGLFRGAGMVLHRARAP